MYTCPLKSNQLNFVHPGQDLSESFCCLGQNRRWYPPYTVFKANSGILAHGARKKEERIPQIFSLLKNKVATRTIKNSNKLRNMEFIVFP